MPFDWAPTPAAVAAILRARVYASEGTVESAEVETWDATTRPTLSQVEELIDVACGELSTLMGGRTPCTDGLLSSAAAAAVYRAAQLVEVSYYPEQTNADQSAFAALEKMWESASKSVALAVTDQCPLPPIDGVSTADDGMPLGTIPCGPLIGRNTCWGPSCV